MAQVTFKSIPIHTSGSLPKKGSKAEDFTLVDTNLKEVSLFKDFPGKKKILSIVPSLDTPVCSLSAKKFNAALKEHPDIQLLIISADLPFAQKRVCMQEDLKNVTTLSLIRSKDFAKAYGVLITDGPLAGLCARAVIVLDQQDRVVYTELVPEITHEPDYDKALQAVLS
jgi:thioredoxin-dependent peroxiredoxin